MATGPTDKFDFHRLSEGTLDWDDAIRENWTEADARIPLADIKANRPTQGVEDSLFIATDEGTLYHDDGSSWNKILEDSDFGDDDKLSWGDEDDISFEFDSSVTAGVFRDSNDNDLFVINTDGSLTMQGDVTMQEGDSITAGGNDRLTPNSGNTRIEAHSGIPPQIYDNQQSAVGVQYDPDATAGVLRTPGAGILAQNDFGGMSSGAGLKLVWTGSESQVVSYDWDAGSYQNLAFEGSLYDFSSVSSDLRLATGQAIEDGSGTARFDVDGNFSAVRDEVGDLGFVANDEGTNDMYAYSGQPLAVRDGEGGYIAAQYLTSASAPGTLELTNADLDVDGNLINNVNGLNTNDNDGDGIDWRFTERGDNGNFRFYSWDGSTDTDFMVFHKGGPVEVPNSNLRLATGQAIEDGGGQSRFDLQSGRTNIYSESGALAFKGSDTDGYTEITGDANRNVRVRDNNGAFTALEYTTSASAPGALKLTNADLDANDHALIDVDTIVFNDNGGNGTSWRVNEDASTDALRFYTWDGSTDVQHLQIHDDQRVEVLNVPFQLPSLSSPSVSNQQMWVEGGEIHVQLGGTEYTLDKTAV